MRIYIVLSTAEPDNAMAGLLIGLINCDKSYCSHLLEPKIKMSTSYRKMPVTIVLFTNLYRSVLLVLLVQVLPSTLTLLTINLFFYQPCPSVFGGARIVDMWVEEILSNLREAKQVMRCQAASNDEITNIPNLFAPVISCRN